MLWLSVWKEEMKNQRNKFEDGCLRRLSEVVPAGCRVTILADRSFGDQKLFAFLGELGFDCGTAMQHDSVGRFLRSMHDREHLIRPERTREPFRAGIGLEQAVHAETFADHAQQRQQQTT